MSETFAIVLGAGEGVRFGGPKVIVPWTIGGDVLPLGLAHLAVRLVDCSKAFLVVRRHHVPRLSLQRFDPRCRLVVSEEPDEAGPAGSIASALAEIEPRADDWLLVTPVDLPPSHPEVVSRLKEVLHSREEVLAARPRHGERRGHPVLVRAAPMLEAYREHRPPLRDVLRALATRVVDVEVSQAEITCDFDRPEALASYLETTGKATST